TARSRLARNTPHELRVCGHCRRDPVRVTGGDSIANTSANGGDGGDVNGTQTPTAASGNSGASTAQSSSTNTGDTGGASSTAVGSPVAMSGDSGDTGNSGAVKANLAARNSGIKGRSVITGDLTSGNTGDSG